MSKCSLLVGIVLLFSVEHHSEAFSTPPRVTAATPSRPSIRRPKTTFSWGSIRKRRGHVCVMAHETTDEEKDNDEEERPDVDPQLEEGLVTREMFLRDMLSMEEEDEDDEDGKGDLETTTRKSVEATVYRKNEKKSGGSKKASSSSYKVLDNRDSLPFVVKVMTPDPYTPKDQVKEEACRNTKRERERVTGRASSGRISSSIFTKNADGTLDKILGEFFLDKTTTCGDVVSVGETQYKVQKARCQYKYAGGKRFVMVRKIVEVKEVTRLKEEEILTKAFLNSPDQ